MLAAEGRLYSCCSYERRKVISARRALIFFSSYSRSYYKSGYAALVVACYKKRNC